MRGRVWVTLACGSYLGHTCLCVKQDVAREDEQAQVQLGLEHHHLATHEVRCQPHDDKGAKSAAQPATQEEVGTAWPVEVSRCNKRLSLGE